MIFLRYSQTLIEANCYIIADSDVRSALVVDPGAGSARWVAQALESRGLELGAVLCTHGHADHVWDAALVAGDKPVYVPGPDMYRMENPIQRTAVVPGEAFEAVSGHPWQRPANVQEIPADVFVDGGFPLVEGVWLRGVPAPGHTEGSTVFLLAGVIDEDPEAVRLPEGSSTSALMLSGDVIFRDGVGRTDLPGGNDEVAAESLRTLSRVIAPATVFFPGHGPASTMGREVKHSVILREYLDRRP
ncbi:MBL fold metallo-hydrolase [Arcanobacterium haemolyticum]|nr:MBL fold metallo-hydrolase [Arcanobacterium haemolyticum]